MKMVDKLKKQRYQISMRIIELESVLNRQKSKDKFQKELKILKEKERLLTIRINENKN